MESSDDRQGGCEFLCWGCGEFGQHCHQTSSDVAFCDSQVESLSPPHKSHQVKLVGSGSSHNVVVTNSDEIFVWGNGNSGQLGCNSRETLLEPTQVTLPPEDGAVSTIKGVSCGGRHTMLWLENGYVYGFGNNFYAQLGYNFQEINYKENKLCPTLLRFLVYRPVMQVTCGDKHTLFLFKDGTLAGVGNNVHGQIGVGNYQEAVVPNFNITIDRAIRSIACGANHNIAITDEGDVYVWGYSKGCGHKRHNILTPELFLTGHNVVQVAGGSSHSMALTANGNVYTWGSGVDGELGHGQSIMFLHRPRRVQDAELQGNVVQIACGEAFSAAVTASGKLFLWGKNSHTITTNQKSSYCVKYPRCMNETGKPNIKAVFCGAWHAAAITGQSDWYPASCESDSDLSEEEQEDLLSLVSKNLVSETEDLDTKKVHTAENECSDYGELEFPEIPHPNPQNSVLTRNMTKLTIEEFYAPSPSPVKNTSDHNTLKVESVTDINVTTDKRTPSSSESRSQLIIQLPASIPDSDSSSISSKSTRNHSALSLQQPKDSPRVPEARKSQSAQNATFCSRHKDRGKKDSLKDRFGRSKIQTSKSSYQRTVQVSRKTANNYAPPRQNTFLVSKSFGFVNADDLLTTEPSAQQKDAADAGEVLNHSSEKVKDPVATMMMKHSPKNGMMYRPHAKINNYLFRRSKTNVVPTKQKQQHLDSTRVFRNFLLSGQVRSPHSHSDSHKHQVTSRTGHHIVSGSGEGSHPAGHTNGHYTGSFNGHPEGFPNLHNSSNFISGLKTGHSNGHPTGSLGLRKAGFSNQQDADLLTCPLILNSKVVQAEDMTRNRRPVFSSATSWRNKRELETFSLAPIPNRAVGNANTSETNSDENISLPPASPSLGKVPASEDLSPDEKDFPEISDNVNLKFSTSMTANVSASKKGLVRNPHKMLGTSVIHLRPNTKPGWYSKHVTSER